MESRRAVSGLAWTLAALLALLFLFQGGVKVLRTESEVEAFTQRYGYPVWFMVLIGALELGAAVLVLLPRLSGWACGFIVANMGGAVYTHVFREGEPSRAGLAVVALALAVVLGMVRARSTWGLPEPVKRWFPRWGATTQPEP